MPAPALFADPDAHFLLPGEFHGATLVQAGREIRLSSGEARLAEMIGTQRLLPAGQLPLDLRSAALSLIKSQALAVVDVSDGLLLREDLSIRAGGEYIGPVPGESETFGLPVHDILAPSGVVVRLGGPTVDWWALTQRLDLPAGASTFDLLLHIIDAMVPLIQEDPDFAYLADWHRGAAPELTIGEFLADMYSSVAMPVELFRGDLGGVFVIDRAGVRG
ncbi:hypothetical protein [Microbacterium sp.]|uniref:hypothetical protein n=1 Tax=Microbacterium sp. TaxID=51671 RepID=UPI0039E299C4